jgi:hypothetical protein
LAYAAGPIERRGAVHSASNFSIRSAVVLTAGVSLFATTSARALPIGNNVLRRAVQQQLGQLARTPHQARLSSGLVYAALAGSGELDRRADAATNAPGAVIAPPGTQGCFNTYVHTLSVPFDDVRVNQDCSFRRQAEEAIAVNPTDPLNLIAGMNDSRIGFNHCAFAWSMDAGKTWGDLIPPFYQFMLKDHHTADACSDPSVAFDAQGNAYVSGILFDISAPASAVVVAKSQAVLEGSFLHSPAPGPFQLFRANPPGIVANDNDSDIAHDKPLMTADSNPSSPKANNVYVVWTRFNNATGAGVGADSPITFSLSSDGGNTWSPAIEISGSNPAYCTAFSGEADPSACDQSQGAQPIVAPNGTVYVAFGNGNTPSNGINQHLIVSCPFNKDCSQKASWTAPVRIKSDTGTQPIGPDPVSGCAAGDQCLPPNGYRLDDFVNGSLSADNSGNLYFVWADFRNGGGSCTALGSAATATPPCNNDVFYSFSTDAGATWAPTFNVTPASQFGQSAQWQPWSQVTPDGSKLFIAFYDRSYGSCETTGCNDITLAQINSPAVPPRPVTYQRVTTASMPNLVTANNPIEAGFLGDYMWLTVQPPGVPLIVWADTRGRAGQVEEDVYFAQPLP